MGGWYILVANSAFDPLISLCVIRCRFPESGRQFFWMRPACSEDAGDLLVAEELSATDLWAYMARGMVEEVMDKRSPAELVREVGEYRWSDHSIGNRNAGSCVDGRPLAIYVESLCTRPTIWLVDWESCGPSPSRS